MEDITACRLQPPARGIPLILGTPQKNYDIADDDDTPDPYDMRMMALLEG